MKTQCEMVLDYMREFGSITTLDAFRDLGVARLASRVHDLRSQGYEITSTPAVSRNRWGKKVTFARYRLV